MSYLHYLCLCVYSDIQYISCCVFVLFFFLLCTICCQFLWIAPSVFSNVYLMKLTFRKTKRNIQYFMCMCVYRNKSVESILAGICSLCIYTIAFITVVVLV